MIHNAKVYEDVLKQLKELAPMVGNTMEIIDAHLTFNPTEVLPICKHSYLKHELQWYLSEDLSILNHEGIENNSIWKSCATLTDGYVNSNYGWCVFSKENFEQYKHALNALVNDLNTRQSICIYTRPAIQIEHNDNVHATRDMICTFATQHMVRNNKLEYIVYMRSNDIVYGLPYDLVWHQYVYGRMIHDLRALTKINIEEGSIRWNAGSLHYYLKRGEKDESKDKASGI